MSEFEEALSQEDADPELPQLNEPNVPSEDRLSSGSTLLNLAASGNIHWALAKGMYFWMCGDSSSGKTWLMLQILAEACRNFNFDEYDLIYDNVEHGALMDISEYFGEALEQRLKAPSYAKDSDTGEDYPVYSSLLEEFYFSIDARLDKVMKGEAPPFIWLLDSMDALTTKYEGDKFDEASEAHEKGRDAKGDFGDGKAKINSRWLRGLIAKLRDSGCILMILSQTRDNINRKPWEPEKVVSGGHALQFYATWRLWSKVGKTLTKKVGKKDREVGVECRIAIKKNRLTGRDWGCTLPIYHSYGIDELGSCVDFLTDEEYWSKGGGRINAPEITDKKLYREQLIQYIEENGMENDLRLAVKDCWENIARQCILPRRKRY